jgi:hypothetical protein
MPSSTDILEGSGSTSRSSEGAIAVHVASNRRLHGALIVCNQRKDTA